jgi:hypothetical protein
LRKCVLGFILRDASLHDAPQDEDLRLPHGEERVFRAALALSGARLEPSGTLSDQIPTAISYN